MRVLVAPDKFRGTLSAANAADAIAAGVRRAIPDAVVDAVPMADGGEGTLDALVAALGGETREVTVSGPLGDPVRAAYAIVPSASGPTAVIEMARASGLVLLARRRDPLRASTRGTGELIAAAAAAGAPSAVVCIGGSATNDAGAGMAQALGVALLDERGRELPPGGAALLRLARIDATRLDASVRVMRIVAATDVDNPLVGPSGASFVYGPQKGATADDVALLDRALRHLAAVVHHDLGIDVRDLPGAGAAGGLGAGLIAFLGARLRPGVDVVMEAVRFRERLENADLVITGEGRFDEQSLRGKVPHGVLTAAEELGVPAIVLCGERAIDVHGVRVESLVERFGERAARDQARISLETLAAEVTADVAKRGS